MNALPFAISTTMPPVGDSSYVPTIGHHANY